MARGRLVALEVANKDYSSLPKKKENNKGKQTSHGKKEAMELTHMFYKELPIDADNIYSANLAENNKVEQAGFKKSKK